MRVLWLNGCSIELQQKKPNPHNTMVPKSNCKQFVKFSLKSAETPRLRSPCTNRPVRCALCALVEHYAAVHTADTCPIKITEDEQKLMINQDKVDVAWCSRILFCFRLYIGIDSLPSFFLFLHSVTLCLVFELVYYNSSVKTSPGSKKVEMDICSI